MDIKVVNINSPTSDVLRQKTKDIHKNDFVVAKGITEKLFLALEPYFPAAGLAAPQIGLDKSVFIYSYDRDPKNLEAVINPTFVPLNEEKEQAWEVCISCMLDDDESKAAKVFRYKNIKVNYLNSEGESIEKTLKGFAAKVFQHETDHLRGIINIERDDAIVKQFESEKELREFMAIVKKNDAANYQQPHKTT